jgi:tetratricopeptide repeat protein
MARRVSAKLKRSLLILAAGGTLVLSAIWLAVLPRDVDTLESLAARLLENREPRRALEALDKAIEKVGSESQADRRRRYDLLSKRGWVNLTLLDRPEHALDDFEQARRLEPGDSRAWDRYGEALLKLEKYAEAARQFEEAATTFPEKDRWFRYAAACAHWRQSRAYEIPAAETIRLQVRPGRERDLDRALERFASSGAERVSQEEIESTLLLPPRGTAEVRHGFEMLLKARIEFQQGDREFADYELSSELSPRFGRVRLEMHRQTGRYYELCRTAELLLRCSQDPADFAELYEIHSLLANGLHEIGQFAAEADALVAQREMCIRFDARGPADGSDRKRFHERMGDGMSQAQIRLVDLKLMTGKNREAHDALAWFGADPKDPGWIPYHLHAGLILHANGRDAEAIAPLESIANKVLDPTENLSWVFHNEVERRRQVGWLADALLGAGRPILALRLYDQLLDASHGYLPFLVGRAAALRACGDRWGDATAAEFELMKVGRDGGKRLAAWEADWLEMKGNPVQLERTVAEQSARVLRLFASDATTDASTADLVQAAVKARTKGKSFITAKEATIETAGFALLRGLESEPELVLQVYRKLVAQGRRDEAYLLLYGLVESQPAVPDFRLLLARHDLADARFEDALAALKSLRDEFPDDDEIAALAVATARRIGDTVRAHRLEEAALGDVPSDAALRLAVRGCLADGYPELAVAAGGGATLASADGRELFGLTARGLLGQGDPAGAEALAQQVLARDPGQRDALAALLELGVQQKSDDGTTACDAWIAANEAVLARLDADALAEIGRAVLSAGGGVAAEKLLRLALERDPTHSAARLALADDLLLLGRLDELDALFDPARLAAEDAEAAQRLALRALLRDGAATAATFLTGRVAAGANEAELARWIGITGAAAGRIKSSFSVLSRHKVELDEEETRFLALCAAAWNARTSDTAALPEADALLHAAGEAATRDRELDRLLSLDLSSTHHDLLEAMAAYVLLERVGELAPLREAERERFFQRFPAPGRMAREEAAKSLARGDRTRAATLLLEQVTADPHDLETFYELSTCAEELPPDRLDALCEALPASAAPPGLQKIFVALRDYVRGDPDGALAALTDAANDPPAKAAALLVRARLVARAGVLASAAPAERPPWCEAGDRERAAAAEAEGDRLLADAAAAAPADPLVLDALRERLLTASRRIDPERRVAFVAALVAQAKPWYDAYEAAIDAIGDSPAERAQFEALGRSFDGALKSRGGSTLPLAAVRTLVRLADLAWRAELKDDARRWLARAAATCPHFPPLLAAEGRVALASGDERRARRDFLRASLFGSDSADLLHWLGRDLLRAGRPEEARAHETRALAAAAATDHAQRAEMNEVLARADYLLGDVDGSRKAWTAAAVERGEDPALSAPIALETFARKGPAAAKELLSALAKAPGPAQQLAKTLRRIATAAEKPEAAKPATAPGDAAPPQPSKRQIRGQK